MSRSVEHELSLIALRCLTNMFQLAHVEDVQHVAPVANKGLKEPKKSPFQKKVTRVADLVGILVGKQKRRTQGRVLEM